MSGNGSHSITKADILGYLETARELMPLYDEAGFKYKGGADEVAIGLMERAYGVIFTGIKLNHTRLTVASKSASLEGGVEVLANGFAEEAAPTFMLEKAAGTTVARFAVALCDLISERATNGNAELKGIMMPGAHDYAKTTRRHAEKHASR